MRNTQSLARRAWVLTTTNKQALEAAVGASPAIEISRGKPYGAREVIEVVKTVMEATGQDSSKGRERWAGTLGVETFSASTAWGCSSWTTRPTSGSARHSARRIRCQRDRRRLGPGGAGRDTTRTAERARQ